MGALSRGRSIPFARHHRWRNLAALLLTLLGGPALAQQGAFAPSGYVTMQNGQIGVVDTFHGDGTATITYFVEVQQEGALRVHPLELATLFVFPGNAPPAAPVSRRVPLSPNPGKVAGAMAAAIGRGSLAGVALAIGTPTMAGVDCGQGVNRDPYCDARNGGYPTCETITALDSQNVTRNWTNFVCLVSVQATSMTIRTNQPGACQNGILQAMYTCGATFIGVRGRTSEVPNYTAYNLYNVRMDHPYGTTNACDLSASIAQLTSCLTARIAASSFANPLKELDADEYSGGGSELNPTPKGPMVPSPQHSPGGIPVVPDIWNPPVVPEIAPGTTIIDPVTDPAFNPVSNPVTTPGPHPMYPDLTVPQPGTDPGTTPGTGTGSQPVNVDVDVTFPDQMDVRCIEGCGVEFQGIEGSEIPAEQITIPTLDTGTGFLPSACPAGPAIPTWGGSSVQIDLQPVCNAASALKGLVIGLSLLAGLYIVIGGLR